MRAVSIALGVSAAFALLSTLAADEIVPKSVQTIDINQLPFDHPSWEPDEAAKKRALLRGYEMNGYQMCCGYVDIHGNDGFLNRSLTPPPIDPNVKNHIDEQTDFLKDKPAKKKSGNGPDGVKLAQLEQSDSGGSNVCTRHNMKKVTIGRSWRCRK